MITSDHPDDGVELEIPGLTGQAPEEIEEYSFEYELKQVGGPKGPYHLAFNGPDCEGYRLCSVSDFDGGGEETRKMLVESLNEYPGQASKIKSLTEDLAERDQEITELKDKLRLCC